MNTIPNINNLAQKLDSILQPYAVKHSTSKGRTYQSSVDQFRLPYQLDRDRVLHSKAFRRLKSKTQVFSPFNGDHFRDRMTHTLEVAQVSRSIARILGLNEDLSEVIALAHDLGHTPFGHIGEVALRDACQEYGATFEHNAQSKRIVEVLESPYEDHQGLNLTLETLEGLQKHQTPFDQVSATFVSATLEAQVVNLADEIAYLNHDLDDGISSRILDIKDVQKITLWQEAANKLVEDLDPIKMRSRFISQIMKSMISDLYKQTLEHIADNKIQTLADVYFSQKKLVTFSQEMRLKINDLRKFLFKNFYLSPTVMKDTDLGKKIITDLFQFYMANLSSLPKSLQTKIADGEKPVIMVIDYISGMTDSYAILKHQEYEMS